MEKIAVFAGSFCPFTKGHEDIVRRALPLFDKIVIAVGHNATKKDIFTVEQRINWISELYKHNYKVEVCAYEGLTVDFCKNIGAKYLLRGVRNSNDIIQESELADINRELADNIETVLLFASNEWRFVSSSFVRELWSLKQDYSKYLSYKLPESQ